MDESHSRRKSWLDLLDDEVDTPTSEVEPIDESSETVSKTETTENAPTEESAAMDVGIVDVKSKPVVDDDLLGAESGWGALVSSATEEKLITEEIPVKDAKPDIEEKLTPGKFTFAQICAKTSNSPTVAAAAKVEPQSTKSENSAVEGFASPEKRERKRSLFPEDLKAKDSFGILDDKIMESPCKDIREIMTNIHMDSPLKQDENEDTSGARKLNKPVRSLVKSGDLRDALRSPNKDGSRKRTREPSKGVDSPANKIAHVSTSPPSKTSSPKVRGKLQYEKDKETLSRRQKQVEYGKNTLGYQRYIKLVPRETREKRHPKTPPRHLRYSRRAWDGLVKVWRQKLHFWDPPKDGEETPTELPESWDTMSDDCSASMSDTTSERSIPTTPQSGRKSNRKMSLSDSECDAKQCIDGVA